MTLFQSSNIVDLKTSILYENGSAASIQLDYHMDVSSLQKPKKKKNRRKMLALSNGEKSLCNGNGYHHNDEQESG